MPKKGELNHKEQEQESERAFRKTRHRHGVRLSRTLTNRNIGDQTGVPTRVMSTSNDMWVWVYAFTICIVLEQS